MSTWISFRMNQPVVVVTAAAAAVVALPLVYYRYLHTSRRQIDEFERPEEELHPLLADSTTFQAYTTAYATYPRIRTFYHSHQHKDKLPSIKSLPLLVFIHGNGGVLPQFAPILGSFVNIAPCFGIELPGNGQSAFEPRDYPAYTTEAFVALWRLAIDAVCQKEGHDRVVLVGHSMGASIAASLASQACEQRLSTVKVVGLIAICPKAGPPTPSECTTFRRLLALPDFIIDTMRFFDGIGYENSKSVKRFVGESATTDVKRQQYRWNKSYRTAVLKRVGYGLLPTYDAANIPHGGYPGESTWKAVAVPTLLVAGEADHVTKPEEIDLIVHYITEANVGHEGDSFKTRPRSNSAYTLRPIDRAVGNDQVLQSVIVPAAPHGLPYLHNTSRLVAGLIELFISKHIDPMLNLGLQLQHLTTSNKWDVKNLEKWRKVIPVSGPIYVSESRSPHGLFRALKTMRQKDDVHSPSQFLAGWADKIYAVVDVSHDAPVYDTHQLEEGGVEYRKLPTVSKIPPTSVEAADFVRLIDRVLAERDAKKRTVQIADEDGTENEHVGDDDNTDARAVAVHCHYGFNRTGFFIVSYLVLRCGFKLEDAIDEFARAKPPGIKHDHFLDELYLRYAGINSVGAAPEVTKRRSSMGLNKPADEDDQDLR